jgi:hypothetical protein
MSGDSVSAELGRAIGEVAAQHMALPPRQKNIHRAAMGAGLLVACAYTAWQARGFTGLPPAALVSAFLRSPANAPSYVLWPVVTWAAAVLLGALWLVVGVAGSYGPRETMTTFWAGVRLCIPVALLLLHAYTPNWPFTNLVLQCAYLSYLAACAVEFLLLVRGPRQGPRQSDTHGRSRTASAADLQRGGILR